MNLLEKAKEILNRYDLSINIPEKYKTVYDLLKDEPDLIKNYRSEKNDSYFIKKYQKYIPKGWYGFSIGSPTPPNWNEVVDEILGLLISNDSDFEIHQIKMKTGRMCFYVYSEKIEDFDVISNLIEEKLFSPKLIY
jgi:hypothetical protein